MAKKTAPLLPSTAELLHQLGERLRVARLRRRMTAQQLAERAGMAPMTLRSLERGGAGVTMGAYLSVMQVLGVEQDLGLLAAADPVGRDLQDSRLAAARDSSEGRVMSSGPSSRPPASRYAPAATWGSAKVSEPQSGEEDVDGFASADELAKLLDAPASPKGKR